MSVTVRPTRTDRGRASVDWLMVAAGALLVGLALVMLVEGSSRGHLQTGDSQNLVKGTRVAADCLGDLELTSCGVIEGTRATEVFPYPLLQYVPSFAFVKLGLSDADVVKALAKVNLLAFVASIAFAAWVFRRRPACMALAVLSLLASSAMYQSTAAFGEMLGAAAVVAAVSFAIERRLVLLFVACVAATLAKETMAPFVLCLTVLASRDEDGGWLPERRLLVSQCAGVAAGVGLTAAFNVFRFGSVRNVFYLDPLFRTPGTGRKLEYVAGEWLSPSAGILAFWPVATLVLIGAVVLALFALARRPRDLRRWAPTLLLVAAVLAFTAGLAAWLSPFGWIAYGPRLAVPLLPGATIVALHLNHAAVERAGRRVGARPVLLVGAIAVVAVLGWPQFGSPWSYASAIDELVAGDDTCPPMIQTPIQADAGEYYRCVSHVMWRTNSLPLDDAATAGGTNANVARVLSVGACVVLLARLRRPGAV